MSVEVVGREEELETIQAFFDRSAAEPAALVLEGEAGIGKTTLWLAGVEAAASRGLHVLSARPAEAERDLAHAGLGDLLEGVLVDVLPTLPAPRRRALEAALLLGEVERPAPDPRALAVAVQTVLRELAGTGPVVLAIDDVQWLDGSSAKTLEFGLRRLRREPVFLLLTHRVGPATGDAAVERVLAPERVQRVTVEPLSLGAIQRLIQTRLETTFARPTLLRLHDVSGGNPFFALELARSLAGREELADPTTPLPLPKTLEGVVHARLGALPDDTRAALLTVAALGAPAAALIQAAGVSDEALEPAYSTQVIERANGEIHFAHPLLASAIYGGAPEEERRRLHRHLADLVDEPVSRARHLALGLQAPDERVAAELEDAAALARARGAVITAAELCELAGRRTPSDALDPVCRRLLLAARDHLAAGDAGRAQALAHELLATVVPGHRRAEVLSFVGELELKTGRTGQGIERLEQALSEAEGDPALEVAIHHRLALVVRFDRGVHEAERHVRRSLEIAEHLGDPVLRSRTLSDLAVFRRSVLGADALELAQLAVSLARESGDWTALVDAHVALADVLLWTGHFDSARRVLEELQELVWELDEGALVRAAWYRSLLELWVGRWDQAREHGERCREIGSQYASDEGDESGTLWPAALLAAHRDDVAVARELARRGLALAESEGREMFVVGYRAILGILAFREGDAGAAVDHFRAAEELREAGERLLEPNMRFYYGDYVEALLELDRIDDAVALLEPWAAAAERLGRDWALGHAIRCRGLVAAARGDLAGALELLEEALARSSAGGPYATGRAAMALGMVRRRAGEERTARDALEQAIAAFDSLRARSWADLATRELARIGGRAPAVAPRAERAPARPFVGRNEELAELSAALDEAAEGRGALVLITGEPGVGKTRLLQEVAGLAAGRGCKMLVGRCWEEGGAPAYWPWIQVVRAAGAEFDRLAASDAETTVDPETVRFRLFDEVTRFLDEAAREQQLVIVLDDLHAADAPSLLLLRFLAERVAGSSILAAGAYRPTEARVHALADLFAELVRVGRRIPLSGLSPADVGSYVTAVTGAAPADSIVVRLHEITGGNPFFLGEIVRLLAADGDLAESDVEVKDPLLRLPEEVRVLIRRRIGGLSTEAVSTLRIAAVVGREFELPILERAGRLSRARLIDVLAEAVASGVVSRDPAGHRYSFAHELVRATLYEDLPTARRLELHLTIGRALEELHRHDVEPYLSEIAHHLALAAPLGDPESAVDYLVRAGDRAAAVLAYEEAAAHYERALELLGTLEEPSAERRCDLLLRLGDAQWRSGEARDARPTFESAIEAARGLGAGEMLARAALGYVTALGGFIFMSRFEVGASGAGFLEEALAALPEEDGPLRARVLARLAMELINWNEPVERRFAVSRQALDMARRLDDSEALVTALHARHWALATPGMQNERLAHTEEMLRVGHETANREMEFLAHNARFHCFLELCEGRSMDAELEAMTRIADLAHQSDFVWHTICLRSMRTILDGRFDDAERLGREALDAARLRRGGFPAYVFEYAQAFAIAWARGRADELDRIAKRHSEHYPWIARWRDALAVAELGDEQAARAEVERHAGQGFVDLPQDGLWILHLCGLAQACVLIGDVRRGEQLYELLLPHAERNAVSYTQQPFGPVALRLGMLATMAERWPEAEQHFQTAAERCELLGARAIRARVLLEQARMLAARADAGDRECADALLEEATGVSEELGLDGILARIERPAAPGTAVLQKEGEFWTIAYAGEMFRLRDVKGLHYLSFLLAAHGKDVHALELVSAAEGHGRDRRAHLATAELTASLPGDVGPILDAQAKEAYRRRLDELGEDLEEARDWGDEERAARVEEEIDIITRELAHAVGLGGRDRELGSPSERARISVTKAIKTALKLIRPHSRPLADHLEASIHTGRFCRYAPPGESPPHWSL